MRFTYQAYGLSIASNGPIRYLTQSHRQAEADVIVTFFDVDAARESSAGGAWDFGHPPANGRFVGVDVFHRPDQHKLRFYHPVGGGFLELIVSSSTVEVFVPEGIPRGDAVSFLIGPVLAIVCRLRQTPCLHASVLAVDGRAFALMGDKGVGKSTTAAMLRTKGAQLVADDVAVIHQDGDGRLFVQPGYPYMRLSREAAAISNQPLELDNAVLSTGEKFYASAYSGDDLSEFPTAAVPLERVYLLSARQEGTADSSIATVDHGCALRDLNSNAYVRYVTNDEIRANDFRLFADLARSGNVRATTRPDNLELLAGFCDELLREFAG